MINNNTYIIIVAAGTGSRFGSDIPKQFCLLDGKPVVMHTINRFREAIPDTTIILVLSEAMRETWHDLCDKYSFHTPVIVAGGSSRWESVKNGLSAIPADASTHSTVLIHDGARPLIDQATIRRVCGAARNTDGAIPAIPVTDSLRESDDDGTTSQAVDRTKFYSVQTPQGFTLWRLREAYSLPYRKEFTDDASVMAEAGFENIVLVEGSSTNIKITNPLDIHIATAILKAENN